MNLQSHICRRFRVILALAALVLSVGASVTRVVGQPPAVSFAGKFNNDKLTLALSPSADGYVGTITLGEDKFPAKASAADGNLTGTFVAAGEEYPFTATFTDGRLMLESGGKTYSLAKVVGNPLLGNGAAPTPVGASDQPPAAAAPADNAAASDVQSLGGFTVFGETQSGKALFIKLPAARTLEVAMTQTADELGKVFDAKPALSGAYADGKSKSKGVVSLTAKLKGQDIHGVIFCGADKDGGSATVVFAAVNAPKQEMTTLLGFMPAPPIKLTTHKFPDGSGSIDLPEGWTTPDQTCAYGIGVQGPAGQRVVWHGSLVLSDPDCSMIRTGHQLYQIQLQNYQFAMQRYQQMQAFHQRNPNVPVGNPPVPPKPLDPDPNIAFPGLNVCRYCDGADEVLKYWFPIREAKGQRAGKGYAAVEKVIAVLPADANPYMAGSKAGIVYMALTDHYPDGTIKHARAVQRLLTAPVLKGQAWQLFTDNMRAPDETFDRDLPVMQAILNSVQLNMDVINQTQQRDGNAIRKIFADKFQVMMKAGQDFQDRQAISFANHERQIAAQEKARHDSNSDFIEYIGGVRKVYDTATGKTLDVDLFNSNAITDGLNASVNNPNQFVQIPLRYLR